MILLFVIYKKKYTLMMLWLKTMLKMSCVVRNPVFRFLTRFNTDGAVQPQKMASDLNLLIYEEESLY